MCSYVLFFFFFKQKTAYEMRISDWSSDVCSSDLRHWDPLWSVAQEAGLAIHFHIGSGNLGSIFTPERAAAHGNAATYSVTSVDRSEERRVGKECVSKCRSRWSLYT